MTRTGISILAVALATSLSLAMAACAEIPVGGNPSAGRSNTPGQSASPTPTPRTGASSDLPGGIANGGSGNPSASPTATTGTTTPGSTVQAVVLTPKGVTLNAPAANSASASLEFRTYQQFSVTVTFTDRAAGGAADVNWESSDPERVSISSGGLAMALSSAATGTVEIRAIAKKDSSRRATASVTVTRNTEIDLVVE